MNNVFSYEYKYSPENNRKLTINLQFTMYFLTSINTLQKITVNLHWHSSLLCNITLINYLKCLIFSFIFCAIIFYLMNGRYKSNNSKPKNRFKKNVKK
jgi:hypothetical protein